MYEQGGSCPREGAWETLTLHRPPTEHLHGTRVAMGGATTRDPHRTLPGRCATNYNGKEYNMKISRSGPRGGMLWTGLAAKCAGFGGARALVATATAASSRARLPGSAGARLQGHPHAAAILVGWTWRGHTAVIQ